jgi:hypothetical protein
MSGRIFFPFPRGFLSFSIFFFLSSLPLIHLRCPVPQSLSLGIYRRSSSFFVIHPPTINHLRDRCDLSDVHIDASTRMESHSSLFFLPPAKRPYQFLNLLLRSEEPEPPPELRLLVRLDLLRRSSPPRERLSSRRPNLMPRNTVPSNDLPLNSAERPDPLETSTVNPRPSLLSLSVSEGRYFFFKSITHHSFNYVLIIWCV